MASRWVIGLVGAAVAAGAAVWVLKSTAPDPDAPSTGAAMADVAMPAELSDAARVGRNAFAAKCAECHGEDASGRQGLGPPLVHVYYEPGHHGDGAFLRAVRGGVKQHHWRFGNMPPVDGLTDADVAAIIAYVRELQRENGIQ